MHGEIASVVLVIACLGWWLTKRNRVTWWKLAVAVALIALLTVAVVRDIGSPLNPAYRTVSGEELFVQEVVVTAWWVLAAKLLVEITRHLFRTGVFARRSRLVPDLLAGLIYLSAALAITGTVFELPIRALVATSGVIAIVLGLALQSTLSDVFSGIAVSLEQPYGIGDRVQLDGQTEGTIIQINWRSVRIQTDGNDIATIPNSLAAKSRIVNRSVPTRERRGDVNIPCPSAVAPEKVMELIRNALLLSPTIMTTPAPTVLLTEVGKKFNTYAVSFSAVDGGSMVTGRSTLLTQVLRQFRSADIVGGEWSPGEPGKNLRRFGISLFEFLSDEQLATLAGCASHRTLDPGDLVFSQGDVDGSLFIVARGVLEVSRVVADAVHVVGRIGPGDYIGEIGLLTGTPHAASVRALSRADVVELKAEHVKPILAARPDLLHALEASARRGQRMIDRAVAASVGADTVHPADLLSRIRAYFHDHRAPAD